MLLGIDMEYVFVSIYLLLSWDLQQIHNLAYQYRLHFPGLLSNC